MKKKREKKSPFHWNFKFAKNWEREAKARDTNERVVVHLTPLALTYAFHQDTPVQNTTYNKKTPDQTSYPLWE